MEEVDVTEQNYIDPPSEQPPTESQVDQLLQRVAALEQQVLELQQQLALAQGGVHQ